MMDFDRLVDVSGRKWYEVVTDPSLVYNGGAEEYEDELDFVRFKLKGDRLG